MDSMVNDYPAGLLDAPEPACLSLYQPTHRRHPENQQDPVRFRNLVKALEESLAQKYPKREVQRLLEPFRAIAGDRNFWNRTLDGLAVLAAPGMVRVYRLQRPVGELAVVAGDSMVAGTVLSLARGQAPRDAVLFGIAAGAAAVMTPGTELCRREDAERLYTKILSEPE